MNRSASSHSFKENVIKTPSSKLSGKLADFCLGSAGRSNGSASRSFHRSGKTPSKAGDRSFKGSGGVAAAQTKQQLGKALKTRSLTPSRNPNFSGIGAFGGDRFITARSESQNELSYFLISSQGNTANESELNGSSSAPSSPAKAEYERVMRDNLNGGISNPHSKSTGDLSACGGGRILAYNKGQAPVVHGTQQPHRVLYSTARPPVAQSAKKTLRHIPTQPERVLDAPDIGDDFYLNILDWSARNVVAVALTRCVYLWNPTSGDISELVSLTDDDPETVTSVKWSMDGSYLAVGFSSGFTGLYDPLRENQLMRRMDGHSSRVGALAWKDAVLCSGSRSGEIVLHDVRVPNHNIGALMAHTQEVCGMSWSTDKRYLASGGNDNIVNVWAPFGTSGGSSVEGPDPLHSLAEHDAAVKAVAWCPWQPAILATGGGTSDRKIKLWNVNTGTCTLTTDTGSQVSSILFNSEYKELISGHGYPVHQLILWKYPNMTKIQELTGHEARVLSMAKSPDEEFVMSASADESLRLWHCFKVDDSRKKPRLDANSGKHRKNPSSTLAQCIR